jgi:hypothetical protein
MKLHAILIPSLLGGALAAAPPGAQREPVKAGTARYGDPTSTAQIYQGYLYGVIEKINPDEMVLSKTKYGIAQSFKFERKTKFIHDGKPSSLDHLKVGDGVWVDVKTDKKSGNLIAKKVVTGTDVATGP